MWPFKRSKELTAITKTPHLMEVFPIVEARYALPAWHKTMPLSFEMGNCPVQHSISNKSGTLKGCPGVRGLLHKGFILPAWEDISIIVYPDGNISAVGASTNPPAEKHDKRQLPPTMQQYTVIKLNSPWYLYGDETQYLFTPAVYHNNLGITYCMPSGIDTYNYQHYTTLFFALKPEKEPYEILITAGQPLIHIIPLTPEHVKLNVKYDPALTVRNSRQFYLLHSYQRYVSWMKRKRDAS